MSQALDALALVGCGLVITALAAGLTLLFAPELRPVIDDPTADDQTEVDAPADAEVDEGPSEVDPAPRLHEQLATPCLPDLCLPGQQAPPKPDAGADRVGNTWVHRSCKHARRDGQPERVCRYCAPRLAGIPTTGGTK